MKITFYYVRHGETFFNLKGRIQGVCDSPLSENGLKQVKCAQKALNDVFFHKAFSSPSERCLDTASYVLGGRGVRPEIIEDLKEMDFGRFEGSRFTSHAEEIRYCFDRQDFSSVGGESRQQAAERVERVMKNILAKCDDQDHVLLTSHGYLEFFFMHVLLHMDLEKYNAEREAEGRNAIPNAGIMVFTYEDGKWNVLCEPTEPDRFVNPAEQKTVHFYYVRHGETQFNMWNRMQGYSDSPLTEKGIQQAEKTAIKLENVPFELVFSSTSQRARRTAEILVRNRNLKPVYLRGLKELCFGDFEGVVTDSWREEINRRHYAGDDWSDVGGESTEQIVSRINHTFKKIASSAKDESNVLIVSHGTYYMNILYHFFGIHREDFEREMRKNGKQIMPNCGVFRFDWVNGKFKLVEVMKNVEELTF